MSLKEINTLQITEREMRNILSRQEAEMADLNDRFRAVAQELDSRTAENDHLVSLLEDSETTISKFQQKEKAVDNLAFESRKKLQEANSERDRVLLKEQHYLR